MMQKPFGLSKQEKLKSRKSIETLFKSGRSVSAFPIRASFLFTQGYGGLQIGVSASKRNFKKAVDRNRIKRLLREAYRLQKTELVQLLGDQQKQGIVFFNYVDKTMPTFAVIKEAMAKCLQRLQHKINEDPK